MKKRILNVQNLLWLALLLALAGSLKHMAAIFASIDGDFVMGWVQAIAIDAGLFALAYSIKIRKTAKRSVKPIWFGVALFSAISIYGNYAYGLLATTGQLPGWIIYSKPAVLAASLPILVLFLSELLSEDRHFLQAEADKEAKRLTRQQTEPAQPVSIAALQDEAQAARRRGKERAITRLIGYLQEHPDATLSEAGKHIGRAKATVGSYMIELEQSGRISRNGNGVKVL